MSNVYLLVTDLHIDIAKANRRNYFGEITDAMQQILDICFRYQRSGCKVNLILLGDICDSSISNASEAMQISELLRYFCSVFDNTYAVVGNHEITYARDNPFWFMVSEIKDPSLRKMQRFIQPRGLLGTIQIPDCIEDGDTTIVFNHFGIKAKVVESSNIKIGVFHQNVGSNDICKMWGTFDNVEEASYVQNYAYCFFGHMHLAKGKYFLNESHTCQGEWLGTLGRTKITEILDDFLQVNVPAIIIKDGKFSGIEDNIVNLLSFSDCVDKEKFQAVELSKKVVEEQRNIATRSYKGSTLLETLQGSVIGTPLEYYVDLLSKPWHIIVSEYQDNLILIEDSIRKGGTEYGIVNNGIKQQISEVEGEIGISADETDGGSD